MLQCRQAAAMAPGAVQVRSGEGRGGEGSRAEGCASLGAALRRGMGTSGRRALVLFRHGTWMLDVPGLGAALWLHVALFRHSFLRRVRLRGNNTRTQ